MKDNRHVKAARAANVAHTLSIIDEIAAERLRQVSVEGFTTQNDDAYAFGELARAGGSYAIVAGREIGRSAGVSLPHAAHHLAPMPETWPFPLHWWKPKDIRADLIRAGALILAAIESLDRKSGDQVAAVGFNPLGSGPAEVGLRAPDLALHTNKAAARFSAATMPSRTAVLQGKPGGLRAEIAERCARAGFATRCLPPRNADGPLHITLSGPAACGKTTFINGLADAGFIIREREYHFARPDGMPSESAAIYGRPLALSQTGADAATVAQGAA